MRLNKKIMINTKQKDATRFLSSLFCLKCGTAAAGVEAVTWRHTHAERSERGKGTDHPDHHAPKLNKNYRLMLSQRMPPPLRPPFCRMHISLSNCCLVWFSIPFSLSKYFHRWPIDKWKEKWINEKHQNTHCMAFSSISLFQPRRRESDERLSSNLRKNK